MKKLLLMSMLCYAIAPHAAHSQTLLPDYNRSYYPTVLQAAEGVGMPFLLQEQYKTMPGVTVKQDSFLVYDHKTYAIHNHYLNPNKQFNNGYYISLSQYKDYGLPADIVNIWPKRMPYALYDKATTTFNSTIDCVGFGTRLLSATGSSNPQHNAYLELAGYIRGQNITPFASLGFVASAYEIAVAFPTLPADTKHGWQYVAGNVNGHVVDSLNQHNSTHKGLKPYTGKSKGGVAHALPGDILSFGYAPGGGSNGHFMVIEHKPELLTEATLSAYFGAYKQKSAGAISALLKTSNVYAVPLYDCSGQSIHFNDSRKYMSGIGHGTLLLIADKETDTPQGFIFSPPPHKKSVLGNEAMGGHVVAITIGRYNL